MDGHFLGGAAEGIAGARELATRTDLAERAQALAERSEASNQQRDLMAEVDKNIAGTMKVVGDTIKAAREARASPDKIRQLVSPLLQGAGELAARVGRDPTMLANQVEAMIGTPMAPTEPEPMFAGSGFDASVANTAIKLGEKIRNGLPLTGEERAAYSLATAKLTEPQLRPLPTGGFQIVQPSLDPSMFPALQGGGVPQPSPGASERTGNRTTAGGMSVSQVPGPVTANEAGRTELVAAGAQNAIDVYDSIVNADGSINRDTVFTMTTDIPMLGRGVPGTEGRNVRAKFEDAAAAKLRLETGAQANESEIQNIVDRFMPSNFDSDATVKSKMDRMKSFFTGSLSRTDPEMFRKLTSRAQSEGNIPDPPAGEAGAEFTGFHPTTGVAVFKRPDGSHFGVPRAR